MITLCYVIFFASASSVSVLFAVYLSLYLYLFKNVLILCVILALNNFPLSANLSKGTSPPLFPYAYK